MLNSALLPVSVLSRRCPGKIGPFSAWAWTQPLRSPPLRTVDGHGGTQSSDAPGPAKALLCHIKQAFMPMQIIKESMRMFPVGGSGIGRYADRDIDLGGYLIPKGTEVACCLHTMQMVPWNFPQPTRFDLGRWLEDAGAPHAGMPCMHALPALPALRTHVRHGTLGSHGCTEGQCLIVSTVRGIFPGLNASEGFCRVQGAGLASRDASNKIALPCRCHRQRCSCEPAPREHARGRC